LRSRMYIVFVSAVAIAAVAACLAVLVDVVSPSGTPLVAAVRASRPVPVSVERVWLARREQHALLVDTRPAGEYLSGHIPGALNVPYQSRSGLLAGLVRDVPRTRQIIVYCDGPGCPSGSLLGSWLLQNGWRRVDLLSEGLPGWRAAGLPMVTGLEP
jgi:rhodanese-related sulfurtransferase